jgi:hypothetical protein
VNIPNDTPNLPDISAEQLENFRATMNGAITVLAPHLEPGEPIKIPSEQLRLIAGVLGDQGTAREVEAYVSLEQKKWLEDSSRNSFLAELLDVVRRERARFEFFKEPTTPPSFPLPSHIEVTNLDNDRENEKIPMADFLDRLRAISASSIFKK